MKVQVNKLSLLYLIVLTNQRKIYSMQDFICLILICFLLTSRRDLMTHNKSLVTHGIGRRMAEKNEILNAVLKIWLSFQAINSSNNFALCVSCDYSFLHLVCIIDKVHCVSHIAYLRLIFFILYIEPLNNYSYLFPC